MTDAKSSNHFFRQNYRPFLLAACLSVAVWLKFTYPQLTFINISVDRRTALQIATKYLAQKRHVTLPQYHNEEVFADDGSTDQYLQKALGFEKEVAFLKEHDLELFSWKVLFFRENEKEQYYVEVSAATGEVTAFNHSIKDTDSRRFINQDEARRKAS